MPPWRVRPLRRAACALIMRKRRKKMHGFPAKTPLCHIVPVSRIYGVWVVRVGRDTGFLQNPLC